MTTGVTLPTGFGRPVADFLATDRRLLVGGDWVAAADGRTFATIDPATEKPIVEVSRAGVDDVDRAVRAARAAFEPGSPWRRTTPQQRARMLWRVADLIERDAEHLAQLESLDNGKLVKSAAGDVATAAELFRYFAGWATKIEGTTIPVSSTGRQFHAYTRREPVGVVAGIVPWNFPLTMACFKVVPSLTAGNTVVLKPAEQTPLSALWLGQLVLEAGFPPGVLNVLPGFGEDAGAALVAHPGVDKVAFTGSTEVGKLIVKGAAGNLKKVSLELGGKAPDLIFADADVERAVAGAALGAFFNEGQCCVNGSRVYVERAAYDDVVAGLATAARAVTLGSGLDDAVMGPLVSQEQHDRVLGYVARALDSGVEAVAGGPVRARETGYFVHPTVLTGVSEDMPVQRDEIFGPVVTVVPFDTEEEGLRMANDTRYGLAAGVWTGDVGRAHRVAGSLRAGTVWINSWHADDVALPRGGYKESGWGRELGSFGLDDFTELKTVVTDIG